MQHLSNVNLVMEGIIVLLAARKQYCLGVNLPHVYHVKRGHIRRLEYILMVFPGRPEVHPVYLVLLLVW
jgi:hypothetical protein